MERRYYRNYSRVLGHDMENLVFGASGARAIAFPTSKGRFFDWEDRGLVKALSEQLERGWLQLFCVDSIDAESWYRHSVPAHDRAHRNSQYDEHLYTELLPWSAELNANPFVISAGVSFGGYHAVNFAFRHPEAVGRVFSMSGWFQMRRFTDGFSDDEIYFNNPVEYMVNEHNSQRLEALRHMDIILVTGRDDAGYPNNLQLSETLWKKNIWHALRVWNGMAHDWPEWGEMLKLYIGGHD
jgi:esterase/lipase superfamily enzyme